MVIYPDSESGYIHVDTLEELRQAIAEAHGYPDYDTFSDDYLQPLIEQHSRYLHSWRWRFFVGPYRRVSYRLRHLI